MDSSCRECAIYWYPKPERGEKTPKNMEKPEKSIFWRSSGPPQDTCSCDRCSKIELDKAQLLHICAVKTKHASLKNKFNFRRRNVRRIKKLQFWTKMSGGRIFDISIEFEIGFQFRAHGHLVQDLAASKTVTESKLQSKLFFFPATKNQWIRRLFFNSSGPIYNRLVSLVAFIALRTLCASSRTDWMFFKRSENRFCSSHYCLSHCMGCRKEHFRTFSLASPSVLCVCLQVCLQSPSFLSLFSRFFVSFFFLSLSCVC